MAGRGTPVVAVRLDESLQAAITDLSATRGVSRSEVVRELLTTALAGAEQPPGVPG
jgi:hypothetical protein